MRKANAFLGRSLCMGSPFHEVLCFSTKRSCPEGELLTECDTDTRTENVRVPYLGERIETEQLEVNPLNDTHIGGVGDTMHNVYMLNVAPVAGPTRPRFRLNRGTMRRLRVVHEIEV